MLNSSVTDEAIVSYLLGDTPQEDRDRLEELYLEDDSVFERMLIVEDEMIFDYARGDMTPASREQFEKSFLTSPERHNRLEFARDVLDSLARGKAARPEQTTVVPPSHAPSRWLPAFLAPFGLPRRLALAAAAVVLMIVACAVVLDRWRLRREVTRLEAEFTTFERDREELRRLTEQEKTRGEELSRRLAQEEEQKRLLEGQLADARKRPAIVSFALPIDATRAGIATRHKLSIAPGTALVRLSLPFEDRRGHESYRITLKTIQSREGEYLLSQTLGRSAADAKHKFLHVEIPASLLSTNDYKITLYGLTGSQTTEIGSYFLRVSRR